MKDVGLILKQGVSLKNGDPEFDENVKKYNHYCDLGFFNIKTLKEEL